MILTKLLRIYYNLELTEKNLESLTFS
jgi:hypothetical protein